MTLTVGVDVGQLADPSAIAVTQSRAGRIFALRLERLPLRQPYPQQARRLATLVNNLRRYAIETARSPADRSQIITILVDVTGIGRATFDLLCEAITTSNARIVAATLTAGSETTTKGQELHIPKQDLIDNLRRVMEEHRLEVPSSSREFRTLQSELRTFLGRKESASTLTTGARSGAHDDLVIALSLACYGANTPTRHNRVRAGDFTNSTVRGPLRRTRGGVLVTTPAGLEWRPAR